MSAPPQEQARYVRGLFGRIAHRYDLLNHLLSFQIDRWWRARTVRAVHDILSKPDARVLDLACGTADLTLALQRCAKARVWGSDFCHPMLVRAGAKGAARLFEADALELPIASQSLDLVTVAFGFRNFADQRRGLEEMRRVLQPAGRLAILEFSTPPNRAFAALYRFYSSRLLPRIGGFVSGSREAYTYLPESVRRFSDAESLATAMREAGYREVTFRYMTFGVVALHTGRR